MKFQAPRHPSSKPISIELLGPCDLRAYVLYLISPASIFLSSELLGSWPFDDIQLVQKEGAHTDRGSLQQWPTMSHPSEHTQKRRPLPNNYSRNWTSLVWLIPGGMRWTTSVYWWDCSISLASWLYILRKLYLQRKISLSPTEFYVRILLTTIKAGKCRWSQTKFDLMCLEVIS